MRRLPEKFDCSLVRDVDGTLSLTDMPSLDLGADQKCEAQRVIENAFQTQVAAKEQNLLIGYGQHALLNFRRMQDASQATRRLGGLRSNFIHAQVTHGIEDDILPEEYLSSDTFVSHQAVYDMGRFDAMV